MLIISEMCVIVEGSVNSVGLSRHVQGLAGLSCSCNAIGVEACSENVWVPIWAAFKTVKSLWEIKI